MKIFKSLILGALCLFPIILSGCENQNISSLSVPKNFKVENGIISFNLVEDAEFYTISINDKVFNVDIQYNSNVEIVDDVVKYDANKLMGFGNTYTVKVKARGTEKYDSHYTTALEYLHFAELGMPQNVRFSSDSLVWDSVEDASYYIVKSFYKTKNITNEIKCDVNYCNILSKLDKNNTGEYQFSVKAVREGVDSSESIFSDVVNYSYYEKLQTPIIKQVYQSGKKIILKVQVGEFANQLTIKCDRDTREVMLSEHTAAGSIYELDLIEVFGGDQFKVLKSYVITAQAKYATGAINYYINSDLSSPVVFNKEEQLASPQARLIFDSELQKYVVEWDNVNNSFGYKIVVDNSKEFYVDKTINRFILEEFTKVKLCAIGSGNYLDSAYSVELTK